MQTIVWLSCLVWFWIENIDLLLLGMNNALTHSLICTMQITMVKNAVQNYLDFDYI